MMKIILLFTIAASFACYSQTDKEIVFKTQFKPNTKYEQVIKQSSKSEITYSGSEDFLQRLKSKGVQNPTITNTQSEIQTLSKTGKKNGQNIFPMTIEYLKSTNSEGKKIIPDGTIIYGHGSDESMPLLDSIVSKELDSNFKTTLLEAMKTTFSQLSMPERHLKVGESFSDEKPLSIPVAGVTIDMVITTTYKLLNVENGIAEFNVESTYKIKTEVTDYTIKASGTSDGKLFFDTPYNNMVRYDTNTKMKMHLDLEKFILDINSETSFNLTSKISSI